MLIKIIISISIILLFGACSDDNTNDIAQNDTVIQKKSRIFEIDITEPETKDYASNIALVKSIGAESISVSLDWTVIEVDYNSSTSTPIYASGDDDLLQIVNDYYSSENLKVTLSLRPVITLVRNTPPDLNTSDINSTQVIDRFKLLLDHVVSKLPNVELSALVIGSEVDLYLQDNTSLQNQYLDFYSQVSTYARNKYSTTYPTKTPLKISVESTYPGLTSASTKNYFKNLNQYSDVIGVSYYPIDGAIVREPSQVDAEFKTLIDLYPNKQLNFYQLGYPSGSTYINSSQDKQADFIDAVFVAWDKYEANISLIDFTWLHDLSSADVIASTSNPAFGGTATPAPEFAEFLGTLGLRTYSGIGTDKKAFIRLKENAKSRGW